MKPFIIWDSTKENPFKKPNYTPTLNQQRELIINDVLHYKLKIKEVLLLTRRPYDTKLTTQLPKQSSKSTRKKAESKRRRSGFDHKKKHKPMLIARVMLGCHLAHYLRIFGLWHLAKYFSLLNVVSSINNFYNPMIVTMHGCLIRQTTNHYY